MPVLRIVAHQLAEQQILIGQYEAALCMLHETLEACPPEKWDGKIAFVTGGASGIGAGLVTKLAEEQRKREKEKKPDTRYGRKELHVAGDKSGRRKRKSPLRRRPVSAT